MQIQNPEIFLGIFVHHVDFLIVFKAVCLVREDLQSKKKKAICV